MEMNGGWIIDLDIRKYFDSIKWTYLCDILKQRVRDGVLIRLLGKWMNEGIMEDGEIEFHDKGVPQGAVISPVNFALSPEGGDRPSLFSETP